MILSFDLHIVYIHTGSGTFPPKLPRVALARRKLRNGKCIKNARGLAESRCLNVIKCFNIKNRNIVCQFYLLYLFCLYLSILICCLFLMTLQFCIFFSDRFLIHISWSFLKITNIWERKIEKFFKQSEISIGTYIRIAHHFIKLFSLSRKNMRGFFIFLLCFSTTTVWALNPLGLVGDGKLGSVWDHPLKGPLILVEKMFFNKVNLSLFWGDNF